MLIFQLIVTLSSTFLSPFYLFISPLLSSLCHNITISLYLYLPLFWLFLFSLFYCKFVIFSLILCIISAHKKIVLSLVLSILFIFRWIFIFYFSYISSLGWLIFKFSTIKFSVLSCYLFFFFFLLLNFILLHYKDSVCVCVYLGTISI